MSADGDRRRDLIPAAQNPQFVRKPIGAGRREIPADADVVNFLLGIICRRPILRTERPRRRRKTFITAAEYGERQSNPRNRNGGYMLWESKALMQLYGMAVIGHLNAKRAEEQAVLPRATAAAYQGRGR